MYNQVINDLIERIKQPMDKGARMKKLFYGFFIFLILMLSLPVCCAEELTFDDYTYTVLSDGTAEITGYSGSLSRVLLPETVNDIKVTSIGSSVFAQNEILEEVTIPDSVISIGDHSFGECTALKKVKLPEKLQRLGDLVFQGNTALKDITLPETLVYIGMNPFDRCDLLESVVLSGENPFYSVEEGILYDRLSNALISYPAGKQDEKYTVPDWVTAINAAAFSENPFISEITLSENITEISGNPFCGCINLNNIFVSPFNQNFECQNNIFLNSQKRELIAYLWNSDQERFSVPSGIISIGNEAFYKHTELTSINLPDTLIYIGDAAFAQSGLTSITFPKNVISLGDSVCSGCPDLKTVVFPSKLSKIGKYAFSECRSLESVTLPKTLNVIGDGAFFQCEALSELKLPENLHFIGDYAFLFCTGLTSVDFPDSLYSIGKGAFYGAENLTATVTPGTLAEEWAINSEIPFVHKNINYITTDSI